MDNRFKCVCVGLLGLMPPQSVSLSGGSQTEQMEGKLFGSLVVLKVRPSEHILEGHIKEPSVHFNPYHTCSVCGSTYATCHYVILINNSLFILLGFLVHD